MRVRARDKVVRRAYRTIADQTPADIRLWRIHPCLEHFFKVVGNLYRHPVVFDLHIVAGGIRRNDLSVSMNGAIQKLDRGARAVVPLFQGYAAVNADTGARRVVAAPNRRSKAIPVMSMSASVPVHSFSSRFVRSLQLSLYVR
jgi:hypothetical protein